MMKKDADEQDESFEGTVVSLYFIRCVWKGLSVKNLV